MSASDDILYGAGAFHRAHRRLSALKTALKAMREQRDLVLAAFREEIVSAYQLDEMRNSDLISELESHRMRARADGSVWISYRILDATYQPPKQVCSDGWQLSAERVRALSSAS